MAVNLPTTLLRSFVAIVDAGTMLDAAEHVFLSQSALSLQIKRLEELVQQPLFTREGRRLALTPSGTVLLGYARKVLNLHDEALQAIHSGQYSGPVRIGTVQDFADTLLTGVLARFSELHPDTQIFARVAGTAELLGMLEKDQLDMVFGYAAADDPAALSVAPTGWYGAPALATRDVIPLAVLETPCRFREAALASLDRAGLSWRIAIETPNLSTLRAAVEAGLGITCRTAFFLRDTQPITEGLPNLPDVACIIAEARDLSEAKTHLAALAADTIRAL
jgi:DNA-binding transcriptional LysR family regulator